MTGGTLFSFVDPKDPFMETEVEGERRPGPILSIVGARPIERVLLFHTLGTMGNAAALKRELQHSQTRRVETFELPVSDPKDFSGLLGQLAAVVFAITRDDSNSTNYVCVSSGTAEMRASWFLLAASKILPATLLQVGSPVDPLFGPANVREVLFDIGDWMHLRDLVMPQQFFDARFKITPSSRVEGARPELGGHLPIQHYPEFHAAPDKPSELEIALEELGIHIGAASVRHAAERTEIAAGSDYPILLQGETGTGKEVFSKLAHRLSGRRLRPLITVNCAAIPKELVESYLFGHVKGAFTGATTDMKGKFEQADAGTLFFDEIGELPLEAQAKLLRVLQDGEIDAVGSQKTRKVDVRIIAATNRNLKEEVAAGRFRKDLYYRLDVVQIDLPALRDRQNEIPLLVSKFLSDINDRRPDKRRVSKKALLRLSKHDWPGNVRELLNVLQRSVLYSKREVLEAEDLLIDPPTHASDPLAALPDPKPGFSMEDFVKQARRQLVLRALEKTGGNQSEAAALLGVSKQAISKSQIANDNSG